MLEMTGIHIRVVSRDEKMCLLVLATSHTNAASEWISQGEIYECRRVKLVPMFGHQWKVWTWAVLAAGGA